MAVRIAPGALDEIGAHARATLPAECCGLLVGTATDIVSAVRSANLADDPTRRFLLDPKTHIDARRHARDLGLDVVGFYHSHPRSEATPSETDLECASYSDHWYLIVRPLVEGCQARLFRLDGGAFEEITLTAETAETAEKNL